MKIQYTHHTYIFYFICTHRYIHTNLKKSLTVYPLGKSLGGPAMK